MLKSGGEDGGKRSEKNKRKEREQEDDDDDVDAVMKKKNKEDVSCRHGEPGSGWRYLRAVLRRSAQCWAAPARPGACRGP